ncbi:hypothetical protein M970_010930 [Encephalitozoon cuniculi EcunIII-L]|nr:hypothetical protein M970_010930 [Encephalitozoon cuniculi EcunIII-L]
MENDEGTSNLRGNSKGNEMERECLYDRDIQDSGGRRGAGQKSQRIRGYRGGTSSGSHLGRSGGKRSDRSGCERGSFPMKGEAVTGGRYELRMSEDIGVQGPTGEGGQQGERCQEEVYVDAKERDSSNRRCSVRPANEVFGREMCRLHSSPLEDGKDRIEKIESMLRNDLADGIVVDVPGPEIVPVLHFFERCAEVKVFRMSGFKGSTSPEVVPEASDAKRMERPFSVETNLSGEFAEKAEEKKSDGKKKNKRGVKRNGEKGTGSGGRIYGKDSETDCGKDVMPEILEDCRYRHFLKRVFPSMERDDERVLKYIVDQRLMLEHRARRNRAEIPELGSMLAQAPMAIISSIPKISGAGLSEEEDRIASDLILKYRNNFKKIKELAPQLDIKKCILKYYLMKDKTYGYIKHKSGRISDSEVKLVVESQWSEYEMNVFAQHFRMFGRSWAKYQSLINKSEKDLKMFFRYYTKFVLPPGGSSTTASAPVRRVSISKEDVLRKWTIDERQVFAIYFPYYNKNWVSMAAYFPSKTSSDLRQYYNRYYKGLSYNEQRLEASLYDFGRQLTTPPARHIGSPREEVVFCTTAGVLFKK